MTMTMMTRKFINGPYKGTNLEIFPSPAATTMPDGTPIIPMTNNAPGLNKTQCFAADGKLDVHARQIYTTRDNIMVGPTIAQQWKSEFKAKRTQCGWVARYYQETLGRDPYFA